MAETDPLASAYERLMVERRRELGPEPTPEEIGAYVEGELEGGERERFEARLAVYPEAARAVADLTVFPEVEPAPGADALTDDEVEASWQSFRSRLPQTGPSQAPAVESVPARLRPAMSAPTERYRSLLAAALAVLAVGAGFLLGRLWSPEPVVLGNAGIVQLTPLDPQGASEVSRGRFQTLVPSPAMEALVVILDLGTGETFRAESWTVEVRGPGGTRLRRDGLEPTPLGTIHLVLPAELSTGAYEIELTPSGGGVSLRYRLDWLEPSAEAAIAP